VCRHESFEIFGGDSPGMKTEYKYFSFVKDKSVIKAAVWRCRRGSDIVGYKVLGTVKWHKRWRQYCFFPEPDTVLNVVCLEDMGHFIKQISVVQREFDKGVAEEADRKAALAPDV